MNTQLAKTHENKSGTLANTTTQKQSASNRTVQHVDNRSETIVQRRLKVMVNDSLLAKQPAQLIAMANRYSSAKLQQPFQKKENSTSLSDGLISEKDDLSGISLDDGTVVQRKITDTEVKERIKAKYEGVEIESGILEILIEDAFENTDNYDEAVARINLGLNHDKAMFGPVKGEMTQRPPIDASDDRDRLEFESSVPEIETAGDELEEEWKGSNTKKFYAKLREMLKVARDPEHDKYDEVRNKLDKLINGYKQHPSVKKLIDGAVRVSAVKAKGASSGTGLDELFKTSETMKYLELSYRPPEGMSSVAKFDGEEFDWMDAQEQIRLSTEFIIWAGDLVEEISGHTGTFQRKYKGAWMTSKQALMHEVRDEAISKRSNPATAIVEAISTHLRITENVKQFLKDEKYEGEDAKEALTSDGHSLSDRHDEIAEDLGHHRDILKSYLSLFRKKAEPSGNSSPLLARHGGDSYYPESPMQYDEQELNESSGRVKGNPLYNLGVQWRKSHGSPAIAIPPKPVHPAIAKARELIKSKWDSKKATSVNSAAKRAAKKLSEDAEVVDVDRVMISVYIEKLKAMEYDEEINEMIQELQHELSLLA